MISILSSPKPWIGLALQNQENAVRSWLALHPEVEVILYGDAEGAAEACARLGVQHVPDIIATPKGVPYFSAIADHAAKYARYDLQCYVNCDILFTKSLLDVTQHIPFKQFLVIGQRIDLAEGIMIDVTNSDVLNELRNLAEKGMAQLHPPAGSDYFLFTRGMWAGLPDIIIGRGGYDNVLIAVCLRRGVPVIDSTLSIVVMHLFHDYNHIDGGVTDVFSGDDAQTNSAHIKDLIGISLEDADWIMEGMKLKKKGCRSDWARHLVLRNTLSREKYAAFLLPISRLIRSAAYKCRLSSPVHTTMDNVLARF